MCVATYGLRNIQPNWTGKNRNNNTGLIIRIIATQLCYNSWLPAVLQRIERNSNDNYVLTSRLYVIIFFLHHCLNFSCLVVTQCSKKSILCKSKLGAQTVVRGRGTSWLPCNDNTASDSETGLQSFSQISATTINGLSHKICFNLLNGQIWFDFNSLGVLI